ncbi:MAG: TAXI family TRAP transporter solute-binding subunit [Lutimaribacter sp.]
MFKSVTRRSFGLLGTAAIVSMGFSMPAAAQQQLSIATGGTGGVYYPMGGGLAEVINNHVASYSAPAEVTGASVENMGLIATGDADLAIGLADTVVQAYSGTGRFEGQQLPMVRGLASLYATLMCALRCSSCLYSARSNKPSWVGTMPSMGCAASVEITA